MTESNNAPNETYIRLNQILEIIPVSRSTWYRGIKTGIYPKQIKVSEKVSAWKFAEIQQCLAGRPKG